MKDATRRLVFEAVLVIGTLTAIGQTIYFERRVALAERAQQAAERRVAQLEHDLAAVLREGVVVTSTQTIRL